MVSTTVFGRTAPVSVPEVILLALRFVRVEPFQINRLADIFQNKYAFQLLASIEKAGVH